MLYITSAILILTAIGMLVCGAILWREKDKTEDKVRTILSIVGIASAMSTVIFIFHMWNNSITDNFLFLSAGRLFIPIYFHLALYIYFMELMKPRWSQTKVHIFLFVPLLLLTIIGLGLAFGYTEINSFDSLSEHIHKSDVLFRLFALTLILIYGPVLLLIPYDYEESKADKKFVWAFSAGIFIISLLHCAFQFTINYVLIIIQQFTWMVLFFFITRYELKTRQQKMSLKEQELKIRDAHSQDPLWEHILHVIETEQEWRNPDLKLSTLSAMVYSNRTYVGNAFKRNTGMGFCEYLSKRRINYVTAELMANPNADIHKLFLSAGFRSMSTAWENFYRVTGMTVSIFLSQIGR